MDAFSRTMTITGISMATVFGVMAILYFVIRIMVRPEK